jgi:hypothetical protein
MTTTWDFPFDSLVSLDRLAAGTDQERSAVTPIVRKNNSPELFRFIFPCPILADQRLYKSRRRWTSPAGCAVL